MRIGSFSDVILDMQKHKTTGPLMERATPHTVRRCHEVTEVTEGLLEIKVYLMPAEQFKSTLTRACWCKLLNCSGARFLRNFAKKPCTLKRITF